MKRFLIVIALSCAFSTNTLAGDIPSGDYVPPPPPVAAPGDMGAGGLAQTITDEFLLAIFGMFAR